MSTMSYFSYIKKVYGNVFEMFVYRTFVTEFILAA